MNLHTLAFVSRPNDQQNTQQLPRSISGILVHGRSRNKDHGISSVLCFHKGQYFQALEGQQPALQMLLANIRQDPRHSQIQLLLNRPITQRLLDDGALRLLSGNESSTTLQQYLCHHFGLQHPPASPVDNLLEAVFEQHAANQPLQQQTLKLKRWPTTGRLQPAREQLELYALLSRAPLHYRDVLRCNPFSNEQQLRQELQQLQQQSLLRLGEQPIASPTRSRFFSSLRQFINRSLSNART